MTQTHEAALDPIIMLSAITGQPASSPWLPLKLARISESHDTCQFPYTIRLPTNRDKVPQLLSREDDAAVYAPHRAKISPEGHLPTTRDLHRLRPLPSNAPTPAHRIQHHHLESRNNLEQLLQRQKAPQPQAQDLSARTYPF